MSAHGDVVPPNEIAHERTARVRSDARVVTLRWGAATSTGNRRSLNEDAMCVRPPVFAVADGMGGHHRGEVASTIAVGVLEALEGGRAATVAQLTSAIDAANRFIFDRSRDDGRTMGTTLTGLAVTGEPAAPIAVFNVGDSRTYHLRGGTLRQVTRDHSHVQELVDAGRISAVEAAVHPERNVVTRALGVEPAVVADLTGHPAQAGERWLICSDGLTELADDEIERHLRVADPQAAATELVDATLAGPARDNVSVVVVDVVAVEDLDDPDRTDPRPRASRPGVAPPTALIDGVPPSLLTGGSEPPA